MIDQKVQRGFAPTKICLVGDTHGNAEFWEQLFIVTAGSNVDAFVQLGDFGYWEHMKGGPEYLEFLSKAAQMFDKPIYWIDGNHENHEWLQQYKPDEDDFNPRAPFWHIRDGLYYIPRGARWEWRDTKFIGVGGAYSIDKASRVPYRSWWPEEELTTKEANAIVADDSQVDVMLCHDVPLALPINEISPRMKPFKECMPHRALLNEIMLTVNPRYVIHGHYHHHYIHAQGERVFVGLAHESVDGWAEPVPGQNYVIIDVDEFR